MARAASPFQTAALLFSVALFLGACDLFPDAPEPDSVLDGPIEGLTADQVSLHIIGDEEFGEQFAPEDGAGPLFIATSCASCHPGDGKGHPVFNLTRFGRLTDDGFDQMRSHGGPQLQHRAVSGYTPELIPESATGVTRLTPPAVSGLGLLEAVDDATILALADPDDADGDGISGRVQLIDSSAFIADIISIEELIAGEPSVRSRFIPIGGKFIGRFGKKGLAINLLHQTVQAYIQDMGLTTDLVPQDLLNIRVGGFSHDDAPDPEVPSSVVSSVVFYLQTLRAPPRRRADHPEVMAGERLFSEINCAACHVPTLRTGKSEIAPLSETTFHPYTDLLLHDMGPELDDRYTEGVALTSEWRTAPLWGLGLAPSLQGGIGFYLHDGRASTLRDAIRFHGGEAAASRAAFDSLSPGEQEKLITFLESL